MQEVETGEKKGLLTEIVEEVRMRAKRFPCLENRRTTPEFQGFSHNRRRRTKRRSYNGEWIVLGGEPVDCL